MIYNGKIDIIIDKIIQLYNRNFKKCVVAFFFYELLLKS